MNMSGVSQELMLFSEVIGLLDDSVLTVFDVAECIQNNVLLDAAEKLEKALEILVTRELELERVQDVLNHFENNTSLDCEDL